MQEEEEEEEIANVEDVKSNSTLSANHALPAVGGENTRLGLVDW